MWREVQRQVLLLTKEGRKFAYRYSQTIGETIEEIIEHLKKYPMKSYEEYVAKTYPDFFKEMYSGVKIYPPSKYEDLRNRLIQEVNNLCENGEFSLLPEDGVLQVKNYKIEDDRYILPGCRLKDTRRKGDCGFIIHFPYTEALLLADDGWIAIGHHETKEGDWEGHLSVHGNPGRLEGIYLILERTLIRRRQRLRTINQFLNAFSSLYKR
jgi:hypothetical protein